MNGDATRTPLQQSGVAGDFTVWADILHQGPVPGDVSDVELRQVRAGYLARVFGREEAEILRGLSDWDAALARWNEYDEVVFWFEHDLFDQAILIRHLDWISRHAPEGPFSLICIGEHPEIPNFSGLGQLSPAQLRELLPGRHAITPREIATGTVAWTLFRRPDPSELERWMVSDEAGVLPFLPGALRRHLEELPGIADGLSRSERQILRAIRAGNADFESIFRATQSMEERVFMGDASVQVILGELGDALMPLVTRGNGGFALTGAGEDVLAGRVDYVSLTQLDRWVGGVHLTSPACWRWDGSRVVTPR